MTVHFNGGADVLVTILLHVYWYEHPNLCPFWPGIELEATRLRAKRLAFQHYAKGTEILRYCQISATADFRRFVLLS